jgi:hypothetical protein
MPGGGQRRYRDSVRVAAPSAAAAYLVFNSFCAAPALAFPPYRSTDANTADPYTLEVRVGLIRLDDKRSGTEILSPLSRINFGLPTKIELISELEYLPAKARLGDGALGVKWVPVFGTTISVGVETLALLPVRPGDSGLGVESQLVVTFWSDEARVHINAGGLTDARVSPSEEGWRASILAEFLHEQFRPGVELFAKQVEANQADVRLGAGLIYDFGQFDIRTGIHAGLTETAPKLSVNFWVATEFPFR